MSTLHVHKKSDDFDVFLEEWETFPTSSLEKTVSTASLDTLFTEILQLAETSISETNPPSLSPLPPKTKKKNRTLPMVWLTAVLFFGVFMGSVFGFFWGKKKELIHHSITKPQEVHQSIELKKNYQPIDSIPSDEVIEPLLSSGEFGNLAPRALSYSRFI